MARINWHNLNANRSYPFISTPSKRVYAHAGTGSEFTLPDDTFTDFGATVGYMADPAPYGRVQGEQLQAVYLASFARDVSNNFTFTFKCEDVPDLSFVFTFSLADAFGMVKYAEATVAADPDRLETIPFEWGNAFMAIGSLSTLITVLGNTTGTFLPDDDTPLETIRVEPSTIVHRYRHGIRRIFIGNDPFVFPADCETAEPFRADMEGIPREDNPDEVDPLPCPEYRTIKVTQDGPEAGMAGVIRFTEGYNTTIRVLSDDPTLELGAQVGDGLGELCQEESGGIWDTIEIVKNGAVYVPSFTCRNVIYTINGVGPSSSGDFFIESGTGVSINPADNVIETYYPPTGGWVGDVLTFSWSADNGTRYALQYRNSQDVWINAATEVAESGGSMDYELDTTDRPWYTTSTVFRVVEETGELITSVSTGDRGSGCASVSLTIEAEDVEFISQLQNNNVAVVDDTYASQGRAIQFNADYVLNQDTNYAQYTVIIPVDGVYVVWLRALPSASSPYNAAARVKMIEQTAGTPIIFITEYVFDDTDQGAFGSFTWWKMGIVSNDPNENGTAEMFLRAGVYLMQLAQLDAASAEDGFRVDQILVTSNTRRVPTCAE